MNTPNSQSGMRAARPAPDDDRARLGPFLELLPFPALVVDEADDRVVLRNEAARCVPLGLPSAVEAPTAPHGIESEGSRIALDQATRHLTVAARVPEGIEVG